MRSQIRHFAFVIVVTAVGLWWWVPRASSLSAGSVVKVVATRSGAGNEQPFRVPKAADVIAGSSGRDLSTDGPDRVLIASDDNITALYEAVRSEPKDAIWAGKSEQVVNRSLAAILPHSGVNIPKVMCATTICEVTVSSIVRTYNVDPLLILGYLQSSAFGNALGEAHLVSKGAVYGKGGGDYQYVVYFVRAEDGVIR